MSSKKMNKLLLTAAVTGASLVARKALNKTWEKKAGRPAPNKEGFDKGDWREIVLWTAVSGAVVGLARLAAHEGLRRALEESPAEEVDEAAEAIDV